MDSISLKQQAYLEAIGELECEHGHAHVSAIADALEVSKPSVVQMLVRLDTMRLVQRQHKEVRLTASGRRIVGELGNRQAVLEEFMVSLLGMEANSAAKEACRLEHVVSRSFVTALRQLKKRLDTAG